MCGASCAHDARFCAQCGERLAPSREEQRKLATMLFCDVAGSTAMGESLDAESVREVMLQFFVRMRRVIETHGGTTQKFIGDAVMAVFGVPVAHEDDALRAVRAGLAMLQALDDLNTELRATYGVELSVRMGINSGMVVAGEAMRDDALVLGDAVNVAARLEQAAPVGEILVSESTHRLVRSTALVAEFPPIRAKGKSDPVRAYRLVALQPERVRARLDDVPIVDREQPLAELTAVLASVVEQRRPRLVLLAGDAGIGKSRLLAEFETRSQATFLLSRCLPYGSGITYWPLAEMVRQATGIREEDTADEAWLRLQQSLSEADEGARIAEFLGQTLGLLPGDLVPEEIAWGARRAFEVLAGGGPVVACFDDLQWAEPRFLDLLEGLVASLGEVPVLLLGLARPELLRSRPDWPVVQLDVLNESDVDTLVSRLATLDDETRSRLVQQSGGSPLFVEELVVATIEEPEVDLPATLEAVLTARLDRFSRAERYVLERGAVEGQVFHRSAVELLLADQEDVDLDATLQLLTSTGVITLDPPSGDDVNYRFRHIMIRDAAYRGIPKRIRGRLHERMADWCADSYQARVAEYEELLAYHLERAYECRAEMGVHDGHTRSLARSASAHLRAAAERALARADHPAAVGQLVRAVALLEDVPDLQLEVLPELGEAYRLEGDAHRAGAVLHRAIERGTAEGNAGVAMISRVEDALLRLVTDPEVETDSISSLAEEAIAMFGTDGDEYRVAKAWALIGNTQWHLCRAGAMEAAFLQTLACLDRTDAPHRPAWILRLLALCYYAGPTPVDEAISRCYDLTADRQGTTATEMAIWASLGALEAMRGDFDQARELFDRSRSTGEKFSLGPSLAALPVLSAPAEILAGDLRAAVDQLRSGCAALEQLGHTNVLSTAAALLGRALVRCGDLEEADRWARTSERTTSRDDLSSQILWRGVRARLLSVEGDHETASTLAAEAVAIAARTDFLVQHGEALLDLAEVYEQSGQGVPAGQARREALALFSAKGHTVHVRQTVRTDGT